MAAIQTSKRFTEELAKFLASRPTHAQLLAFRPSKHVQHRAQELLQKQNEGETSYEERQELEEDAHAERLMRLIKAKLQ